MSALKAGILNAAAQSFMLADHKGRFDAAPEAERVARTWLDDLYANWHELTERPALTDASELLALTLLRCARRARNGGLDQAHELALGAMVNLRKHELLEAHDSACKDDDTLPAVPWYRDGQYA